MNYFNLAENIGTTDRILRMSVGMTLLLLTFTEAGPYVHPSIFPALAAYLVLTAIMKWDPAGFIVEMLLRMLGQSDVAKASPAPPALQANYTGHH